MDRVTVTTPLGLVTLEHSGTAVRVIGENLAVDWWHRRVADAPFGAQGHLYHPNDCDICDVIAVALTAVGSENVDVPKAAAGKAAKQLRSTPKGALS